MNAPYRIHNDEAVHARLLSDPLYQVAPYLRVLVLGDPRFLGPEPLAYSINESVTAAVCVRTGPAADGAVILGKRHAHAWGTTKQDLWFTALRNMATETYDLKVFQAADTVLNVVTGHGWPGTAHVMRLVELSADPMPYGALAMLPSPNTLMFAPLRSRRSMSVVAFMWETFQELARGGMPVTDQIVWWRGGTVMAIRTEPAPPQDGRPGVRLNAPAEFGRMVEEELPA
ncbi:hypothetical protein ACQEU5_03235 [Marinactinospora thermotolerans]|uniref:Uncharacterized protein n=1 Tax=Marinactinospora thermotolerans DSM 45154 TaxID=1122192 RepID=A0A1T4LFS5_9ACTN|nr:hypothetical protein [Marinactinospora thermotolerans]SJZ53602.1 hypothetical protein SAMN02745673_00661 [Marinactinospora thermotolerans DSM 45154]